MGAFQMGAGRARYVENRPTCGSELGDVASTAWGGDLGMLLWAENVVELRLEGLIRARRNLHSHGHASHRGLPTFPTQDRHIFLHQQAI